MNMSSPQDGPSRIGYLIPEFPGQTHAFFWRELRQLQKRNGPVECFSTKRPSGDVLARHDWAGEAAAQTFYLMPLGLLGMWQALCGLASGGPVGWWRVLKAFLASETDSLRERIKMLGAVLVGARLVGVARAKGITHVHVHSCANAANAAMFANQLAGLRYSMTLHGSLDIYGGNQRQKWSHAAFCIILSQTMKREIEARLAGVIPEHLYIASMGVDVDDFKRPTAYEPYDGAGSLNIFSCSRLNPGKRVIDLLEAVGMLHARGVQASLTIAGGDDTGGGYLDEVKEAIDRLGLKDHVQLIGNVSEAQVLELLLESHLFALASENEGVPVVIMEAMAVNVPVVVTRVGGIPELVRDEVDGLLVEPYQPEQLAEALLRVAQDPAMATAMAEASRLRIEEAFHSGVSAEAILKGVEATRVQ